MTMRKGFVIWLTGMSGAGKSTTGQLLEQRLRAAGVTQVEVLDGDAVRTQLCKGLGYSKEDRDENVRRIGFVCELLARNGVAVIVAAISPYRAARDAVRARVETFIEVHVDCSLAVLVERDVKGLYKKALSGEIAHFTGVSDPYEAPLAAEVVIDSASESPEESLDKIWSALTGRGLVLKGLAPNYRPAPLIDLHSHTNESDGTFSPAELIAEAQRVGVRTLAITDHDTFAGYDQAVQFSMEAGVHLICGIELSTKWNGTSVHLLGYFFDQTKMTGFRKWILELQTSRKDRNRRLIERLREVGVNITMEEVDARGRGMTGRPHFARVLMDKGYVSSIQQAFDVYLADSGKAYVDRMEPPFAEAVRMIRDAGGITSIAHPVRWNGDFAGALPALCKTGLHAIEAYHSDHSSEQREHFLFLAKQHGLRVTGGSDFHGAVKPGIQLGTGREENVCVPAEVLLAFPQG